MTNLHTPRAIILLFPAIFDYVVVVGWFWQLHPWKVEALGKNMMYLTQFRPGWRLAPYVTTRLI